MWGGAVKHMITRKQYKAAVIALIALYVLIFIARSVYDLITYEDLTISDGFVYTGLKEEALMMSNVASYRKEYKGAAGVEVLDQKYEQIASVSAKTVKYDDDLAKLDSVIEGSQAVVQTENAQGLAGGRKLTRKIGVKPQFFDECLAGVSKIGTPISSTTQKIDKTYEYRQMIAQKQEYEKRLESYIALRDHGGSINELLNLEDKIIEVESQILRQSVDLGEYSDDNALCTINFSLYEGNPVSIARKIWNAFVWTNKCYFAVLGGALMICVSAALFVAIYFFIKKTITSDKKSESGKNEK